MRYLITGGAGFIGSHVCRHLLKENAGNSIIVIDNLWTGSYDNIAQLPLTFIQGDVRDRSVIESLPPVDRVIHLASPASVPVYQQQPITTITTNVIGTLNVLKYCKRHRCSLLFSSTSEVYGDPQVCPQSEDNWGHVNPIGVRACYDESKRLCECLIIEYRRKHQLDLKIVRIFNTYGSQMQLTDGRIIPTLLHCLITNQPMPVYGGEQTRSFCHVDDVVNGLMLVLNSSQMGPINVGNPTQHYTIREVVRLAEDILHQTIPVIDQSSLPDDPVRRQPDIHRAQQLGFNPTITLRDGLTRLFQQYNLM
jgi:UDP-glucuronate decarboxylase